jgi:hypothetical protein
VGNLYLDIRAWASHLNAAVPGFNSGDFVTSSDSPVKVVGLAEELIEFVQSLAGNENVQIPFAQILIEDLTARKDRTNAEWIEAQDYLAQEQELRSVLREKAETVNQLLIALRRTLRATLGFKHRDYKAMQLNRGARTDVEETTESQIELSVANSAGDSVDVSDTIETTPITVPRLVAGDSANASAIDASADNGNDFGSTVNTDVNTAAWHSTIYRKSPLSRLRLP